MSDHRPPPGGVDLSRMGQVAITDCEVWPAAAVIATPGGLPVGGGDHTLQVVNIAKQHVVLIPFEQPALRKLYDAIGKLLQEGSSQHGT